MDGPRRIRVLGLDPGLRRTGWGAIDAAGNRLSHVANGAVVPDPSLDTAGRLAALYRGLAEVIARHRPDEAAVEETFVNKNPESTLKLGLARGAALLAASLAGLPVAEYAPNRIKKSVVGVGHADKRQVQLMVGKLLPGAAGAGADAADALAAAICHAHFAGTGRAIAARGAAGGPPARGGGMARAVAAALAREAAGR